MLATTAAALLALLTTTLAIPTPIPTPDNLSSWKITSLATHSPSGRPGNNPYSYLNFTITDPNTIPIRQAPTGTAVFPPSTATCYTQWLTREDVPWGIEQACSAIQYGAWTFKLTGGESATTDFEIEVRLVDNATVLNQVYTKTFVGERAFKVGTELVGNCGGSGVCNWGLGEGEVEVEQVEVVGE